MRRTASVLTALVIGGLALGGGRSDAGPDKIAFPAGFQQNLVLYTIADRPAASSAPSAARSTQRGYASRTAVGRRLASGPL
jgi:hypothetical protein